MSEEASTAGWDAIDKALRTLYPDQEPKHYGTLISYMLGGPDPLDGISVYDVQEPRPHWHFVTYGFSELYDKESDNKDYSGFGFELTFRLAKEGGEAEPPAWAHNLLQNMGRYVFNSGNVFRPGDYLDANGPICLGSDTLLTALAFTNDPELGLLNTPNGQLEFIQMTGITGDELEAMQIWNTNGLLKSGADYLPYFITDLTRPSVLSREKVAAAVEEGSEKEGSSTGFLYNDQLSWQSGKKGMFRSAAHTLQLGAKQAKIIGKLLRGRILKGRELTLVGPEIRVVFEPGITSELDIQEEKIRLQLDEETVTLLSEQLQPLESSFSLPAFKGLTIQILKTHIKDTEGQIVHTIG
ncbi:suppressor of fused domain protein [Paenibacillus sp. JX-17]|uniref:Suppressor of fused domain protein n=1 Tax=Paenibacillus lacisoli TaxID=3064525 RepID=A0ABT9CEZ9_9BACL|nr:suppressor of fused domain protein [Paenibacillus sp. JX-17]MDO7907786.1 suppressor of fused domain protein [Paenibacillus sp. JX-17]